VARKYHARVTFINVIGPDSSSTDTEMALHLEASLKESLGEDFSQLATDVLAHSGDPVDVITRFVHVHGVSLIMIPTYGHGPFRISSLGSVAAGILHGAQCPVWTSAHAKEQPADQFSCRSVVCAVDATPKSTPVIDWAARFARDWGARLGLVHVVPVIHSNGEQPDAEAVGALKRQAAEAIDGLQRRVGVRAPVSVSSGNIAQEVREEAQRQQADTLVIGRGLLDTTRGRLGRHSRGIIQRAPCPVVSV
jgi:nucleotide-binding universal stress UspA family protein